MNEIDLIKEVEKHAILYDKSVSGFNKTKLRDDAWKLVSDALNVSESECKKRWRSLRDSFIKLQRTHGGRTRWPYHVAMRFLLPHVEPKHEHSNSQPKPVEPEPIRREQTQTDESDQEDDRIRSHHGSTNGSLPDLSFAVDPTRISQLSDDEEDESPAKKPRPNSAEDEAVCNCNRTDPDELFLLSCAPTLKRLNGKQNAVARLKIQQVLYEAEFGGPGDLPYVTPGSDCGFDHIDEAVE